IALFEADLAMPRTGKPAAWIRNDAQESGLFVADQRVSGQDGLRIARHRRSLACQRLEPYPPSSSSKIAHRFFSFFSFAQECSSLGFHCLDVSRAAMRDRNRSTCSLRLTGGIPLAIKSRIVLAICPASSSTRASARPWL